MKAAIESQIEKRETTFAGRSEKWQESERGEEWEMRTESLQTAFDFLDDAINELEELT